MRVASAANGQKELKLYEESRETINSFDGVKQRDKRKKAQQSSQQHYYHYQYEPYPSNYYTSGCAIEQQHSFM